MNEKVRAFLIDYARSNRGNIYYSDLIRSCNLPIDLDSDKGQLDLKKLLINISTFEHAHNRPLLSSLAISKKTKNQGPGFYDLAEQLKFGSKLDLQNEFWGFKEADRARQFWRDNDKYQKHYTIVSLPVSDDVTFFTEEDFNLFKAWQYQAYDPSNEDHKEVGNQLKSTVWAKTFFLANKIIDSLPGFFIEGGKYWTQRGWKKGDGKSIQAAIVKPYTWAKILRHQDAGKDIFFTVGLDMRPEVNAFVYKIDCQETRDSILSKHQIEIFHNTVPKSAKWQQITLENVLLHSYDSLANLCKEFIVDNLAHYDAAILAVEEKKFEFASDMLFQKEIPVGFSHFPFVNHTFGDVDIDFEAEAKKRKVIGNAGEDLVIEWEQQKLRRNDRHDLADLVKPVKDGNGFDISSYTEKGDPMYIEVKTTHGGPDTTFFLSAHELAFLRESNKNYYLYRLYNYNALKNTAYFFVLPPNVESSLLLEPVNYAVVIKQNFLSQSPK